MPFDYVIVIKGSDAGSSIMKVNIIQDKLSDKLAYGIFMTQMISPAEEDYPVSNIGVLAMAERVTKNVCLLPVRSQPDSAGTRKSSLKEALKGALNA